MSEAAPYLRDVRAFLSGGMSAERFAQTYADMTAINLVNRELYSVVMQIFFLAESYTTVPGLAEEQPDKFITESQLREGVEKWVPILARFVEAP
jgi:Bacterial self-protective colicin-like immunity